MTNCTGISPKHHLKDMIRIGNLGSNWRPLQNANSVPQEQRCLKRPNTRWPLSAWRPEHIKMQSAMTLSSRQTRRAPRKYALLAPWVLEQIQDQSLSQPPARTGYAVAIQALCQKEILQTSLAPHSSKMMQRLEFLSTTKHEDCRWNECKPLSGRFSQIFRRCHDWPLSLKRTGSPLCPPLSKRNLQIYFWRCQIR